MKQQAIPEWFDKLTRKQVEAIPELVEPYVLADEAEVQTEREKKVAEKERAVATMSPLIERAETRTKEQQQAVDAAKAAYEKAIHELEIVQGECSTLRWDLQHAVDSCNRSLRGSVWPELLHFEHELITRFDEIRMKIDVFTRLHSTKDVHYEVIRPEVVSTNAPSIRKAQAYIKTALKELGEIKLSARRKDEIIAWINATRAGIPAIESEAGEIQHGPFLVDRPPRYSEPRTIESWIQSGLRS